MLIGLILCMIGAAVYKRLRRSGKGLHDAAEMLLAVLAAAVWRLLGLGAAIIGKGKRST